jgi:hypothetical protein
MNYRFEEASSHQLELYHLWISIAHHSYVGIVWGCLSHFWLVFSLPPPMVVIIPKNTRFTTTGWAVQVANQFWDRDVWGGNS